MATGNDDAHVDANQQQPAIEQVAEPAAQATIDVEGIDDRELREAEAALQAEEAKLSGTQGDGADPSDVADQATPASQPGGPPAAPLMVPKARLDEVLSRASTAEQEVLRLRGFVEGLQAARGGTAVPGAPSAPPAAPTQQDRLNDIATRQDALAAQYDNGDISFADYQKQSRALTQEEWSVREAALKASVGQQTNGNGDFYLQSATAKLETEHPWIGVYEAVGNDADWTYIRQLAYSSLLARGVDFSPEAGDAGKYELRKEMGALMDKYGPTLMADRARAQGIPLPGAQQQQQRPGQPAANQQQQQLTQQQRARLAKLDIRSNAPPNVPGLTGYTDTTGDPSEAAIMAMTDEQIAALPDTLTNKLLGFSP